LWQFQTRAVNLPGLRCLINQLIFLRNAQFQQSFSGGLAFLTKPAKERVPVRKNFMRKPLRNSALLK